ncbi:hypothetical protein B0F90DRAFT_1105191 [Multifurca ochricompacta]|uniref:Uncharacterized protein n=1 Tax=Multifurca ochricompacta TaxID=376703 RepID=A0AAD4M8H4_9AGAM|nr:hypothetical protein B0F90DRAFT_1105191 [Multifurca ochricompacta]
MLLILKRSLFFWNSTDPSRVRVEHSDQVWFLGSATCSSAKFQRGAAAHYSFVEPFSFGKLSLIGVLSGHHSMRFQSSSTPRAPSMLFDESTVTSHNININNIYSVDQSSIDWLDLTHLPITPLEEAPLYDSMRPHQTLATLCSARKISTQLFR